MTNNIIKTKSYQFALDIIDLYKRLLKNNEFVLSKQLLKAATSIGANVEEAIAAQTRKDFLSKMSIASKEARECHYWLKLLQDSNMLPREVLKPFIHKSEELIRILTAIVKTTSSNAK